MCKPGGRRCIRILRLGASPPDAFLDGERCVRDNSQFGHTRSWGLGGPGMATFDIADIAAGQGGFVLTGEFPVTGLIARPRPGMSTMTVSPILSLGRRSTLPATRGRPTSFSAGIVRCTGTPCADGREPFRIPDSSARAIGRAGCPVAPGTSMVTDAMTSSSRQRSTHRGVTMPGPPTSSSARKTWRPSILRTLRPERAASRSPVCSPAVTWATGRPRTGIGDVNEDGLADVLSE